MIEQNFIKLYENNFKKNWELPAITDYKETTSYTYGALAEEIARLHVLFSELHLRQGDKIALIGKNHSSWSIVFLATITYGAVIVPILHEFNPESMNELMAHSESKLLFVTESIWEHLDQNKFHIPIVNIPSFSLMQSPDEETAEKFREWKKLFHQRYPQGFKKEDILYPEISNEEVICINYTSGTTGFSKGVMLTANNFAGNVTYAAKLDLLFEGEPHLAFLPMAHAYGCAFDFLYALSVGVHVTLLGIMPTPQNLLKAFEEIKPKLIISVPLIFEKIYKRKILPIVEKPVVKFLL
ncbi:MAG TPA: long-chain fatty acid--CoA ligase, partial [Porphyromonadaceae bacterium]|nr:long-chain fatty acid--CoA ligase [Porphyromonadaceae bacterium]